MSTTRFTPTALDLAWPRPRAVSLDRLRGLAVLAMVADHVTLLSGGPEIIRLTVGRLAMPLFFLVAGVLVQRFTGRHLLIGLAGLALPLAVPWIDNPNVLVYYAAGTLLVVVSRRVRVLPWVVPAVALTLAANGYDLGLGRGYQPLAIIGLMHLGALLGGMYGPHALWWGERLPGWVGWPGRHALGLYVGHLLLLETLHRLL